MKQSKLTEYDIQKILERRYLSNPQYVLTNLYVFDWESDFLAKTRSGYWYEVEIKRTFYDFKNDAKHKEKKFNVLESGRCARYDGKVVSRNRPNYFSYCVVEEIVDKVLPIIPPYAGLYYVKEESDRLFSVKAPFKLHSDKIDDAKLKLQEKFYYNMQTWRERCENWQGTYNDLKNEISWLKAEYKAVTGESIYEQL